MTEKEKQKNNMHEMIISMYDYPYCYSLRIDGSHIFPSRDIIMEFIKVYGDREAIKRFMKMYNCNRLIVCEDGGIEIYTKEELGND